VEVWHELGIRDHEVCVDDVHVLLYIGGVLQRHDYITNIYNNA
jgi:hypothetical protein